MVVMLIVAAGIILVAQLATRKAKMIPSGLQNFVEWLVESLYDFFEGVLGEHMVKKTFWFFATIFIFILFTNWFGLLPGMGTVGWAEAGHHNEHISEPLLRGVNADLNMTLAMAAMFMVLWLFWSLQALGVGGFFGHIFNVKGHGIGFFGFFLVTVFIFVGLIEMVSIGVRPVALTFRLYGNIFAGENILETVMNLGGPYFGWLAVLPFYFLEILVGLVQALVFALLTAVFTALMCEHHDEGTRALKQFRRPDHACLWRPLGTTETKERTNVGQCFATAAPYAAAVAPVAARKIHIGLGGPWVGHWRGFGRNARPLRPLEGTPVPPAKFGHRRLSSPRSPKVSCLSRSSLPK